MRHAQGVANVHASGDPPADRHFADAEKFGAFGKVGVFFEGHTIRFVSTGRQNLKNAGNGRSDMQPGGNIYL